MSIKIGDALLKLGVDKSEFDKSMSEASQHVKTSMEKMQTHLRVASAAFMALGVAGLKMVSDARKLNAELGQTALTLGVSTKEMRNLALATTDVTFPLKSVTATFDLLARAGIRNTEEMQKAAKAFDALADATGSSAEVVADILIPAFKSLGANMPQTSAELDKFTWLTKNTTVELEEFGSVMQYVAMYGADLGVKLDDMIAIMAALEARGISGSAATRLFRTAVTQAADGSVTLNEALGVSQEQIDGFRQQMDGAIGITDEYAKVANEQYGFMDKLKQKWSEVTLQIGSFLTPFESMFAGMTALSPVMMFLSTSMGRNTIAWVTNTAATIAHTVALVASKIAIGAVTVAQWLWNAAMTANPIGIVVLAIGVLVAAIILMITNWDKVVGAVKAVWNTFKQVWDKVVNFFKDVWKKIVDIFKKYWEFALLIIFPPAGIIALFKKYWEPISEFFKGIWTKITGVFTAAWEGIVNAFKSAVNFILGMINTLIGGFEGFLNLAVKGLNWFVDGINSATKLINRVLPSFLQIPIIPMIGEIALPRIPLMDMGGLVEGPGLFRVGNGVKEVVRYPEGLPGLQDAGKSVGDTININLGVLPGDDVTARKVARMIKDVLGEESRRTAFGQVNQGYFYGRSSI